MTPGALSLSTLLTAVASSGVYRLYQGVSRAHGRRHGSDVVLCEAQVLAKDNFCSASTALGCNDIRLQGPEWALGVAALKVKDALLSVLCDLQAAKNDDKHVRASRLLTHTRIPSK